LWGFGNKPAFSRFFIRLQEAGRLDALPEFGAR
jgi:hypothetical protein